MKVLSLKKEQPRWGKEKLTLLLKRDHDIQVSSSTVYRILKRHRLAIKYHTRKRTAPKPRVNLAEIYHPGDLIQLDTKYIYHNQKLMYQYTAIDVVSRWCYATICPNLDGNTTKEFLTELNKTSPVKISMVQTDNGKEFGRVVTTWLRNHKIKHVFSHKARPTENTFVERSHRTDEEEFYSIDGNGKTTAELRDNFAKYIEMYNNYRPHWGLKGLTPNTFLSQFNSQATVPLVLT